MWTEGLTNMLERKERGMFMKIQSQKDTYLQIQGPLKVKNTLLSIHAVPNVNFLQLGIKQKIWSQLLH